MKPNRLRLIVLGCNSLALLLYLVWLAGTGRPVLYRREGVLYLLPCIPLFFVYLMVLGRPQNGKDPD
jgi:hypothetical protein